MRKKELAFHLWIWFAQKGLDHLSTVLKNLLSQNEKLAAAIRMYVLLFAYLSAGGFVFLHACEITRYKSYKSTARRLYLNSIVAGLILFKVVIFIYFVYVFFRYDFTNKETFTYVFSQAFIDNDNIVPPLLATICFIFSYLLALVINWGRKKYLKKTHTHTQVVDTDIENDSEKQQEQVLDRYSYLVKRNNFDEFEMLCVESYFREMPLSFTLNSSKVYVGYVKNIPIESYYTTREFITIMPLASGYRDECQNLSLTTFYFELIENYMKSVEKELEKYDVDEEISEKDKIDLNLDDDFELVIKFDTIVTVNLFDPKIYSLNQQSLNATKS